MSGASYAQNRDFFGKVSGNLHVGVGDTGVIGLVPAIPLQTISIQKIHVEVTTPMAAELWSFQDGVGVVIVPNVSAAAVAHFDFDFGPDGVPCTEGSPFNLNISGATGAIGWITWEAYQRLTKGAAPFQGGAGAGGGGGGSGDLVGYYVVDDLGGDPTGFVRPLVADVYPAGVTFDDLVPGSSPMLISIVPGGSLVLEASARVEAAGGRVKVALFNLDTDTIVANSELVFDDDDVIGSRQRSATLTLASGVTYGLKSTTDSDTVGAAAWNARILHL